MKVKIVNNSVNPLPEYSTSNLAGMDLRANLEHGERICQMLINKVENIQREVVGSLNE